MQRLFRASPLEDSFACNFNVLVDGVPRVLGVRGLLKEWTAFRIRCVRRRTSFDLKNYQEKLHLLKGLRAILLDIDKAVAIIRQTEEENEVVPNLMIGFGIDRQQAEYVAEIKLKHLNREYILKRTEETSQLEKEIADLQKILGSDREILKIIVSELEETAKKFGKPRRSMIVFADELKEPSIEETPDYPVNLFFTKDGYFKKITPQSLRMSGEQKLKEGDAVTRQIESVNSAELLFFTDCATVYKTKAADFSDSKASVLGDYIPAKLGMNENETPVYMAVTTDYSGYMLFFFENGKVAKVDMASYATKTNRKKLVGAYDSRCRLIACSQIETDCEFLLTSSQGKVLLLRTGAIQSKASRNTQGVAVMKLRKSTFLNRVRQYRDGMLNHPDKYRKNIPAAGLQPSDDDKSQGEQLSLD